MESVELGGILQYEAPQAQLFAGGEAKGRGGKGQRDSGSPRKAVGGGRDLLDTVILPRSYTVDGITYTQKASLNPAVPSDVVAAQRRLDTLLQQRQAREMGLCPVRSALYTETFDEVIRQVTLLSAERGLLLLRAAYQTAYESAVAFGLRSAVGAQLHQHGLDQQIANLRSEIDGLRAEQASVEARCVEIQEEAAAKRADDFAKHKEEVDELMKVLEARTRDLEEQLAPKKK